MASVCSVHSFIVVLYMTMAAAKPEGSSDEEEASILTKTPKEMKVLLLKHGIIPDLLTDVPPKPIQIEWGAGPSVNFGNVIDDFGAIKESPFWVEWEGHGKDHYALFMLGLDEPSRSNHSLREWKYWVVVNIEGNNTTVCGGEHLAHYLPPYPVIDTGMHRYVFLVYKQKRRQFKLFKERHLYAKYNNLERGNFSVKAFAKKYNLEGPIAVNFFLSEGKYPPWTDPPEVEEETGTTTGDVENSTQPLKQRRKRTKSNEAVDQ